MSNYLVATRNLAELGAAFVVSVAPFSLSRSCLGGGSH